MVDSVERTVVVDTNAVETTPRATRRNDKLRSKIDDLLMKISASKSSAANVEEYKRNRERNLQDLRRRLDASTAEIIEKTRVIKVQECQTSCKELQQQLKDQMKSQYKELRDELDSKLVIKTA